MDENIDADTVQFVIFIIGINDEYNVVEKIATLVLLKDITM